MSLISRDGDKKPEATPEMIRVAKSLGLSLIQIMCDREGAALNFYAMVEHVPRIGESIRTQDGKPCLVETVFHAVVPVNNELGEQVGFRLCPVVYAVLAEGG